MEIITHKEAKAQGLKRYFTGKPCKHGHVAERQVSNGSCIPCQGEGQRKHYRENRERLNERKRKYRRENREKVHERDRKYRRENREKFNERSKKYHRENRERLNELSRRRYYENIDKRKEYRKKYNKKNRVEINKYAREYRNKNWEIISVKAHEKGKEDVRSLSTNYVKQRIKQQFGISIDQMPPELIEMKRNLLKQRRLQKAIAKQRGE